MYVAQKAIGVRLGVNKRWENIPLTVTVQQMFQLYRRVQLELLPDGAVDPVFLDLQELAPTYSQFNDTITALLAQIGNASLPTTAMGIQLNPRKAYYRDAFKAGYRAQPVSQVNMIDLTIPNHMQPNIRLTREGFNDYQFAFEHMLVSINGYYHQTDADGVNGLMVVDAMKSVVRSDQNQIGLLSFSQMCSLQTLRITDAMLDLSNPVQPVITLPASTSSKSIVLSFGGVLMFVDGQTLTRVGQTSYKIDLGKMQLVDMYYESINYLDMTSLGLNTAAANNRQIVKDDLITEPVVRAWMKLSQSFVVVLDTPNLYTQHKYLGRSGFPGIYFTHTQPNNPIVLEDGRSPAYWTEYDDKQWRVTLYNNVVGNDLFYTNPAPSWRTVSESHTPGDPARISRAYELEIGRDY